MWTAFHIHELIFGVGFLFWKDTAESRQERGEKWGRHAAKGSDGNRTRAVALWTQYMMRALYQVSFRMPVVLLV